MASVSGCKAKRVRFYRNGDQYFKVRTRLFSSFWLGGEIHDSSTFDAIKMGKNYIAYPGNGNFVCEENVIVSWWIVVADLRYSMETRLVFNFMMKDYLIKTLIKFVQTIFRMFRWLLLVILRRSASAVFSSSLIPPFANTVMRIA